MSIVGVACVKVLENPIFPFAPYTGNPVGDNCAMESVGHCFGWHTSVKGSKVLKACPPIQPCL